MYSQGWMCYLLIFSVPKIISVNLSFCSWLKIKKMQASDPHVNTQVTDWWNNILANIWRKPILTWLTTVDDCEKKEITGVLPIWDPELCPKTGIWPFKGTCTDHIYLHVVVRTTALALMLMGHGNDSEVPYVRGATSDEDNLINTKI